MATDDIDVSETDGLNWEKINVKGNKRISNETIKIFSEVNLNSNIESKDLNLILKRLYETNFFKDVSVTFQK